MASYDVVIAGGGDLGLWTAYSLANQGWGRSRSANGVGPGVALPAARPGWSAARWLGDRGEVGAALRELYLRLGMELGLDSGFTETGYYIVAETEEEKESFLRLLEVRREAGVENEWIEPEEGRRRFPDLNWDRFVGATYTPDDGYVHPPIAARNATYAAARSRRWTSSRCARFWRSSAAVNTSW